MYYYLLGKSHPCHTLVGVTVWVHMVDECVASKSLSQGMPDELMRSEVLSVLKLITHDYTVTTVKPHEDITSNDINTDENSEETVDTDSQHEQSIPQACPFSLPYIGSDTHVDTDLDETPPLFPDEEDRRDRHTQHPFTIRKLHSATDLDETPPLFPDIDVTPDFTPPLFSSPSDKQSTTIDTDETKLSSDLQILSDRDITTDSDETQLCSCVILSDKDDSDETILPSDADLDSTISCFVPPLFSTPKPKRRRSQ